VGEGLAISQYESMVMMTTTVLTLLLAALLGLSGADYERTVSYEGEVVVRW